MPSTPDLTAANERVSIYRCGECPHLERSAWRDHQAHYESHKEENK